MYLLRAVRYSMKFYWIKTRWFIRRIFPSFVWKMPAEGNSIYLTFDDGPTPEITPWVLDQLKAYNAKATFFCIGDRIDKSPELFKRLIDEGHTIGNHTYNHYNAWKTDPKVYMENFEACEVAIEKIIPQGSRLFRPPYAKIRRNQRKELIKSGKRIIMWDVLSADFDQRISPQQCTDNVVRNLEPGSIVIFHDSVKASKNLYAALPETLAYIAKKGWKCEAISPD